MIMMAENQPAHSAARWHFHPIISPRAHQEVVTQITYAILSGAFQPEERLPNIDVLAKLMNVSKPVVGEALKVLSSANIVRTQRGINGGLTVGSNRIPDDILAVTAPLQHLGVRDVVEARKPIEIQLCLLAAQRATAEDFAAMQACIDGLLENRNGDLALRLRFDQLFHYAIGRAARSAALALYQHQVLEHLFISMRQYFADIEDVDDVARMHTLTMEAIRRRDTAEIVRVVEAHLAPLEESVGSDMPDDS
ncbi:FCD domain-containing protein [Aquibium sp. LZ166]|uniref:FCD domain-containing protein n=1 Tax=Aquibium pacificus TaxID=3153579 RepID=A0ABV3SLJ2_9HYPH